MFFIGFWNLNRRFKHKLYPMPKRHKMLLNLECFQYTTSLELNMVYYHIRLSEEASNICTIILPWGKYKYKCLPMRVYSFPEIF